MNLNVKDFLGRTPLHSAFMLGKVDMARELIRYGLNPNETDNNGKTPMDLAKEMKSIVFENLDIKV
jgi:ankyrin repeat protein